MHDEGSATGGPASEVVNIRGVCIKGGLHPLHLGAWADPPR